MPQHHLGHDIAVVPAAGVGRHVVDAPTRTAIAGIVIQQLHLELTAVLGLVGETEWSRGPHIPVILDCVPCQRCLRLGDIVGIIVHTELGFLYAVGQAIGRSRAGRVPATDGG